MAKVDLSKLLHNLRGKIGGLVFRRLPNGTIVVSGVPRYRRKSGTPRQKAYRHGTFRSRTQWAKWAYHEYPVYTQLAAEQRPLSAYNIALSDIAHPPVIHRIHCKDGRILVQASDNVMVSRVGVSVSDEHGRQLEWLEAVHVEGDWWECVPQQQGRIAAQAWDIPGNRACFEME